MEEESRVISSDAIASANATDVASSSFSQPNADTNVSDPTGNIQKATDIEEVDVNIDDLVNVHFDELIERISQRSCSLFSGFTDKKSTLSEAAPMEEESRAISSDAIAPPNATDVASSSFSQPNADTDVSDPTTDEVNVDIDELIEHISQLLEFIEKGEASRKLKTGGRDCGNHSRGLLTRLNNFLSEAINITKVKDVTRLVAEKLERFEVISFNKTECLSLLKGMIALAKQLNQLKERPMLTNVMEDSIKEGIELIMEASIACSRLMASSKFSRFSSASLNKRELLKFNERIDIMYRDIQNQMAICIYDEIIRKPLQQERRYPEYAVGIEGPTQEVIEPLDETLRGSFHDICSFFNGWDWNEVANIVGASKLNRLVEKALVIKDTNTTARVPDAILSYRPEERSGRVLTSASEIDNLKKMKDEDIRRITGIWLLNENKDPVSILASKLDLMSRSLRVLALGNLGKVEGKCKNVFGKLVFLQAGIPHLPFDVGKIKKLRYFSSEPKNLKPNEGSSTHREQKYGPSISNLQYSRELRMESPLSLSLEMHKLCNILYQYYEEFIWRRKCTCLVGRRQKRSLLNFVDIFRVLDPEDIYDRSGFFIALKDALHGLKNFTSMREIEDLPHGLGNLIYLSREIDLLQSSSYLKSIVRLMSLACSLDISYCSGPDKLPDRSDKFPLVNFVPSRWKSLEKLRLGPFGELKSLRVLNLQECWLLKKLPQGFGKLKDLVELDLSFCLLLEELSANFHDLSSLQTLKLSFCESLKKLPEKFHDLASLQLLSLRSCKTLEGESMDNVVKIRTLEKLFIEESPMLKQRWEEIQRLGHTSSCHVYT